MISLVTAGGLIVDCVVAGDGAVSLNQMGGNGAYSAVGARIWASPVGIIGCVPRNYPRDWLTTLRAHDVLTDAVVTQDEDVHLPEWFLYRPDGSRADGLFATAESFRTAGYGARLEPGEIARWEAQLRATPPSGRSHGDFRRAHPATPAQVPESYFRARGIHIAPDQPEVQLALARAFRARGRLVTLDPRPLALPDEMLDALLNAVDAFLPSEKELAALVPNCAPADALAALAKRTKAILAVKIGAAGSLIWDRARRRAIAIPAFATVARDPTGAGDSWCGGFLAGLVETGDPVHAACRGAVSSSFVVEGFGVLHGLSARRELAEDRLKSVLARVQSV
jgi:sugar/nucleoside kinase (ribokinase family)